METDTPTNTYTSYLIELNFYEVLFFTIFPPNYINFKSSSR